MPICFESFMGNRKDKTEIVTNILQSDMDRAEDAYASDDKKNIHLTKYLTNKKDNKKISKIIYTMKVREKEIEFLDADVIFTNENKITLKFLNKLEQSTEGTCYYEVENENGGQHFEIQAINFFKIGENLSNTIQNVSLSVLPFQLSVYESIEELNNELGFSEPIKVGNTDLTVQGFGEDFIGVGSLLLKNGNEPSTFLIGKVKDYEYIDTTIGNTDIEFLIIYLETGIGTVPVVAPTNDYFDLRRLKKGSILGIFADVKADLS